MKTTLSPIREREFNLAAARHLLWRVGYAGRPEQVRDLQAMGLDGAVDHLVDYRKVSVSELPTVELDRDILYKPTPEQYRERREARRRGDQDFLDQVNRDNQRRRREDRQQFNKLRDWWLERMILTPRPAEERLTLLWHGHFASSYRAVRDAYMLQQQHHHLREHANGNFADLALGIVRDPAMLKYLNNNQNNKRRPNENLARELMELFTLGEGNYTEADIKEGARALTGYTIDDDQFVFRENQHDRGRKTILGHTDTFDGDGFVKLLLRHRATSKFVALKLYDHFVADVGDVYDNVPPPQRSVIDGLAKDLLENKYRLRPVLTRLFKSQHFHDPAIVGRKIKDPSQLLVGTIRGLGTPRRQMRALTDTMRLLGQALLEPPTVDGWDGGRSWINTSTLFARQNLTTYLISGKHPTRQFKRGDVDLDPMPLLAGLDSPTPAAAADHLLDHLVGPHVAEPRRAPIRRFMQEQSKGVTPDSLVATLCLITAMPEYQLC